MSTILIICIRDVDPCSDRGDGGIRCRRYTGGTALTGPVDGCKDKVLCLLPLARDDGVAPTMSSSDSSRRMWRRSRSSTVEEVDTDLCAEISRNVRRSLLLRVKPVDARCIYLYVVGIRVPIYYYYYNNNNIIIAVRVIDA